MLTNNSTTNNHNHNTTTNNNNNNNHNECGTGGTAVESVASTAGAVGQWP